MTKSELLAEIDDLENDIITLGEFDPNQLLNLLSDIVHKLPEDYLMSYEAQLPNTSNSEVELIIDKECSVSIDYHIGVSLNSSQCREWAARLVQAANHLEFNGK